VRDVQVFDRQPALGCVSQVSQAATSRTAHGADDVLSKLDAFKSDGVSEAAGSANKEEDGAVKGR
jgi:hypothetical protein